MRPVFQTHVEELGAKLGNCLQAATASFLHLPLESVPNFATARDFDRRMRDFFRTCGFELIRKPPGFVPRGFYFETGISHFGHEHIVVMRAGHLMHDPNPLGAGLVKADAVLWPRPLTGPALSLALDIKQPREDTVDDDEQVLKPIPANEGVRVWYQEQMQDMARRMARDILRKLRHHFEPASDRLAQDDDPIVALRTVMRVWGRLWQKRFDDMSKDIAASFAGRTQRYTDAQIRRKMREAGFTVRFKPTDRQLSAYRSVIATNVGLIKSIPQEFLKDVEGAVWRAVQRGGAMGELSTEIRRKYGVTYRRAAFIARDQVNKSKSVLENARRAEIGITEAFWHHSHAGKQPRPTHVKMDGKRFKIADGMYDSAVGRNVQPGEEPGCRCSSRAIIPGRFKR